MRKLWRRVILWALSGPRMDPSLQCLAELVQIQRSLLLGSYLRRYHEDVAPSLKRLRAHAQGSQPLDAGALEQARVQATGLFNEVYALRARHVLPDGVLEMTIAPRAADLWCQYVAPLDVAVRVAAGGSADPGPVERFYAAYAKRKD